MFLSVLRAMCLPLPASQPCSHMHQLQAVKAAVVCVQQCSGTCVWMPKSPPSLGSKCPQGMGHVPSPNSHGRFPDGVLVGGRVLLVERSPCLPLPTCSHVEGMEAKHNNLPCLSLMGTMALPKKPCPLLLSPFSYDDRERRGVLESERELESRERRE